MIGVRRRRAVSTRTGAAKNMPSRVALAPSGLGTRNVTMQPTAYSAAPRRTTRSAVATATTAATASDQPALRGGTGSARPAGTAASPRRSEPRPNRRRTSSRGPPGVQRPGGEGEGEHDPGNRARRGGQERRAPRPSTSRRRRTAASAASPMARPRAKVSRPTATLTTVPAANSTLAAVARRYPLARAWNGKRPRRRAADDRHRWPPRTPRRGPGTGSRSPACGGRRTTGCSRSSDRPARRARVAAAGPASRRRASRAVSGEEGEDGGRSRPGRRSAPGVRGLVRISRRPSSCRRTRWPAGRRFRGRQR